MDSLESNHTARSPSLEDLKSLEAPKHCKIQVQQNHKIGAEISLTQDLFIAFIFSDQTFIHSEVSPIRKFVDLTPTFGRLNIQNYTI